MATIDFPNASAIRAELVSIQLIKIKEAIAEAMMAGKFSVTVKAELFPKDPKELVNALRFS